MAAVQAVVGARKPLGPPTKIHREHNEILVFQ